MATVKTQDVRLPRAAWAALARHEEVVVVDGDRPLYVILNAADRLRTPEFAHGRPLADALAFLRAKFAAAVPREVSLADELIADRRREAGRDADE